MGKNKEGFIDGLLKDLELQAIVEGSKDSNGKPDPHKAAGIAAGLGHTSLEDTVRLGAILGSQGAFDDDYPESSLNDNRYGWRAWCEDGWEYGVSPEDYETEDEYNEALEQKKYGWRDTCEDGIEYGIDSNDYETEEEYKEALEEEKYGWRDTCEDGLEYGINPEDYETEEEYEQALEQETYDLILDRNEVNLNGTKVNRRDFPNQRRYNAACGLEEKPIIIFNEEYWRQEQNRYRFILGKADTILAANYLSADGEFLYAQAVKDHFNLPVSLPDEDEKREYEFYEMICKIAKKDISLSFEVWEWCLEIFWPYAKYDSYATKDLTKGVIDKIYNFQDEYMEELILYMDKNSDFRKKVMENSPECMYGAYDLVVSALKMNLVNTAIVLFVEILGQTRGEWKDIIDLVNDTIRACKTYDELETMEKFEKEIFPLVKKIEDGMIQDEIEGWEKEISEYIDEVECTCDKYAFSRKNSWRKNVSDEQRNIVNPLYYNSEEEYIKEYNKERFRWRKAYENRNNYGLNPNDYDDESKFRQDRERQAKEQRERNYKRQQNHLKLQKQEAEKDNAIYTYCGVVFSGSVYHYRTNDTAIKVGDNVIVPVGRENLETEAKVVSVGNYARIAVPFPVEKTKFILRKVKE